jgi:hypothetical protein
METRIKLNPSICLLLLLLLQTVSCSKKPTDFRNFLGGSEIVYPGAVSQVQVLPGNDRLELTWHSSADPSVARYVVYWNNYADSLTVPARGHNPADTVKSLISNLQEYTYTFFIYSFDSVGNKSISTEVDNARVYGSIYQGNLLNRPLNRDTPYVYNNDSTLVLKFLAADTINITTKINYTNMQGNAAQKLLSPAVDTMLITDYHPGTAVVYQSSYIPVRGAIDTFTTTHVDTVPPIFRPVQCDKSLFKTINLPYDETPYESDTYLAHLWDGSTVPGGYPDIYHSDGSLPLPSHFSFDMGKEYSDLSKVEEIGRNCCHNPVDFEIWGISDTTGAVSQLAGNDPGWTSDVQSKGWTLLDEVVRTDDGSAPFDANLIANAPPVRFIMVRVLKTADNSTYVNATQMTFWYKQ